MNLIDLADAIAAFRQSQCGRIFKKIDFVCVAMSYLAFILGHII